MDYTIKAIPTVYRGVKFRSRLEARWAAFFDLYNANWTYEPYDLDGWMPDFELIFASKTQIPMRCFIEVKPFLWRGRDPFDFIDNELRTKVGKHRGVIVGAEFDPATPESPSETVIGLQMFPGKRWHSWTPVQNGTAEEQWRLAASMSKREYA